MRQLKTELDSYYSKLSADLSSYWTVRAEGDFSIKYAVEGLDQYAQKFVKLADTFVFLEEETENNTTYAAGFLHFELVDVLKDFFVLWRDAIFETHRALIVEAEGKESKQTIQKHLVNTQATLSSALVDVHANNQAAFEAFVNATPKKQKKQLQIWEKRTNPWSIYKKQIGEILEQSQSLLLQHQCLLSTVQVFSSIRTQVFTHFEACQADVTNIERNLSEVIQFVGETIAEEPKKVVAHLVDLEKKLGVEDVGKRFTAKLDAEIALLDSTKKVSVDLFDAQLVQKEIDFAANARAWLDAEILPLLFEIWELSSNASNGMKMSILNVCNRASIVAKDKSDTKLSEREAAEFALPLETFLKKEKIWKAEIISLEALLKSRFDNDFWVSAVFHKNYNFLPVIGETLTKRSFEQAPWIAGLRGKWQKVQQWITTFQNSVEEEEALSTAEKLVRYVQSRVTQEENHAYSGIFLTKGYVSETFLVEREAALRRFETLIENWELGVRGAVLLSGNRLCGKSLFGEVVSQRYFPNNTVHLKPNAMFKINGRKFTTTTDLKEALDFIRKHAHNTRPLVWIDDLELWAEADLEISLGRNVRKLQEHITSNANRIFYMVSMGNFLKAHLAKIYDFSAAFQAEIGLDFMSKDAVFRAILIRHGATHKNLVGEEGVLLNQAQLKKLSNQVFDYARGNIGDALNIWAQAMKKVDDEQVKFELPYQYELPNVFTPNVAVLFTAIMVEKRTNEYRLRKLFGPAFSDKYSGILQRFIGNKLLLRQFDGWLEVNELLVNDIGRQLERKKYLRYSPEKNPV